MTTQSDPRVAELLELAANEGRPLALRPEEIIQLENGGACVDPFSGRLVLPVLRWLSVRGKAVAVQFALALLIVLASQAPLPVAAQTTRPKRPSPVPICRQVHGVRICLPVHGGSGITPPIFTPGRGINR